MRGGGDVTVKKPTEKEIRQDLLDQLMRVKAVDNYYTDMVHDYIELYRTKKLLLKDIKARGVSVEYCNGGGQSGIKKNDSVDQLLKVNQQMIKILDYLGIKPPKDVPEDDDDEM